ncbi:MAG: GTPase Era [Patescibacteria group bacterium]
MESNKKAGFVVILGRSNVGKSTLLNSFIGSKIAITSPKPQTTRLPVQGILTQGDSQIVFVDTPGVFQKSKDRLTSTLLKSVKEALEEVDIVLYVVDPTREVGNEEKQTLHFLESTTCPKILVINKCDLPNKNYLYQYNDLGIEFNEVIEASALRGTHINSLIEAIKKYLPEHDFYYPEHQFSNMPHEVWLAELIREKLFLRLRQEVPYTTHVQVDEIEERESGMMYIKATIFTTDDRYKSIIIGKGGRGIKEIGQSVRNELEQVLQKSLYLDLNVEVDPHWETRLA